MTGELRLRVGGLHTLTADLSMFRPTHMVGILDPTAPGEAARAGEALGRELLVLRFRDTEQEDGDGPLLRHVEQILQFVDSAVGASATGPVRLFIHCHAGVSRSTAAAYLALVRRHGLGRAEEAFKELLALTTKPWPNRRVVGLADAFLDAGGRLLTPLDSYRNANPRRLEAYARLHRWRCLRDPNYAESMGMSSWRWATR